MFWKNKKNKELIQVKSDDRRNYFRIKPTDAKPVYITFGDSRVQIADISAGGLSFSNSSYSKGDILPIRFFLPDAGPQIKATIRILEIDGRGFCHCSFSSIEEQAVARIHKYVLNTQKESLRKKPPSTP